MSLSGAKNRRKILVATMASVIAVACFFVAVGYSSKSTASTTTTTAVGLTQVVALNRDLPVQTRITADFLKFTSFPTNQVTTDNIRDMKDAIGKVNVIPIAANSILLSTELRSSFITKDAVALHAGNVAVSLPFDPRIGFGGFVHPEDHFDILCDSGQGKPAYYCFTNVRVLEVGDSSQQPSPAPVTPGSVLPGLGDPAATPATTQPATVANATVLVVEMSREDAAKLRGTLAASASGKDSIVAYVLRAATDFATASPTAK